VILIPEAETLFDDYANRFVLKEQQMEIGRHMRPEDLKLWRPDDTSKGLENFLADEASSETRLERRLRKRYARVFTSQPEGQERTRYFYQRYMQDYLRCVAAVDEGIGQLLDYLDKSGLAENTIVVYASDQGFYCR
jgi:arylsulfatase A-like enzyme